MELAHSEGARELIYNAENFKLLWNSIIKLLLVFLKKRRLLEMQYSCYDYVDTWPYMLFK